METGYKIRLALVCGGTSTEREVSLAGAREVERALDPERYIVKRYDPAEDLQTLVEDAPDLDAAFVLLHGRPGEDGTIQGMLDLLGVPYQGSGVLGSALAMDKHLAKSIYRQAGIPTPDWVCLDDPDALEPRAILERLGLPVMVKPSGQGSSVGMAKVTSQEELEGAVRNAFEWDGQVVIERFVRGRELTGGVLGLKHPDALPIVEIIPGEKYPFFDYEAKYKKGATRELCPAPVPGDITRRAQEIALEAHKALRLRGYSRTDMILSDNGEVLALETNTIPGMTPTSLFPQAAEAAGLSFSALLDRLIEMAMEGRTRGPKGRPLM